jgi:hypothetical protein
VLAAHHPALKARCPAAHRPERSRAHFLKLNATGILDYTPGLVGVLLRNPMEWEIPIFGAHTVSVASRLDNEGFRECL